MCSVDFLVAYGKKSFEEILFKKLPTARNNISFNMDKNKIFNKNPYENALEYLAFGGGVYYGSPTARHLNENLENNL